MTLCLDRHQNPQRLGPKNGTFFPIELSKMGWKPTALRSDTFQRLQQETMNDPVLEALYQMVMKGRHPTGQ